MRILFCDDDFEISAQIKKRIEDILDEQGISGSVSICNDPKRLLKEISKNNVDLLLLDITMPEMSGFDVARELRKIDDNLLIIFITAMDVFVYDSFKYAPFRFLRKNHLEELRDAICDAAKKLNNDFETFTAVVTDPINTTFSLCSIVYFASHRNDITLVAENKKCQFRGTLNALEEKFSSKGFVRIYRTYLVNLNFVEKVEKQKVLVEYGSKQEFLPISREKYNILLKKFMQLER